MNFGKAVGTIQSAIVFLESPGGSLMTGISIGLTIRKKGFETAVADGTTCTSACAIAWLGGKPRRMGENARIGFHEPWEPSTKESSLKGDALLAAYVRKLGLPYTTLTFMIGAGPKSMAWLTEASSSAYRIYYVELRKDQGERYREALDALHADLPAPVDVPIPAAGSRPMITGKLCAGIKTFGVEEIIAQAAKRISSGDVAGAREMLSKFAAPIDIKSAARIAFALAETYDPNMLAAWGKSSVPSDAPLARRLYRQAIEHEPLAAKARDRLAALGNY